MSWWLVDNAGVVCGFCDRIDWRHSEGHDSSMSLPGYLIRRVESAIVSLLTVVGLLLASCVTTKADWPEFRGPWGNGYATAPGDTNATALPLHWSETSNVVWKSEIPDRGWSTPVVMNGQVWLTTATIEGHDYFNYVFLSFNFLFIESNKLCTCRNVIFIFR